MLMEQPQQYHNENKKVICSIITSMQEGMTKQFNETRIKNATINDFINKFTQDTYHLLVRKLIYILKILVESN